MALKNITRRCIMVNFLKNLFYVSIFTFVPFIIFAAEEVTFTKHIKPIFEKRCYSCHSGNAPYYEEWKKNAEENKKNMIGMKMDDFRSVIAYVTWPNTGSLMRRLDNGSNTKDGKPGNMYEYLGESKEEREANLKLIKDWVGYWTLKRLPDLSKDEILALDKIKTKY